MVRGCCRRLKWLQSVWPITLDNIQQHVVTSLIYQAINNNNNNNNNDDDNDDYC